MKAYQTLNIGVFHTNHCEDFLIVEKIASNRTLIAVLDGCTMGTESVFASILFGKILRKIAKQLYYEEFAGVITTSSLQEQLKSILKSLMSEAKITKNQLGLETNEMLSTLIIGVIDESSNQAELLAIGDGLVCIDGQLKEFEQDDKPDYLGYHLSKDYDSWYKLQSQKVSVPHFFDLSICTDGIFTFKNMENKEQQKSEKEVIDFLLINQEGIDNDNLLERKVKQLKDRWGHVVTDDLAIIRIRK